MALVAIWILVRFGPFFGLISFLGEIGFWVFPLGASTNSAKRTGGRK